MNRKTTREIKIGNVKIGGNNLISIQSMTNTLTSDISPTLKQIDALKNAGANIVRLGIPNKKCAEAIGEISKNSNIPLVADIHFDHKLALICLDNGIDALRLNPGNMRKKEHVKEVLLAAKECKVSIRIGINGGSLPKDLLEKYGSPTPEAMVEAAEREIEFFKEYDFSDYKVSLKSSNVINTIKACEIFSEKNDCPLHIGITEAGIKTTGYIRSAFGIGYLLHKGIGDTIRVSLTTDPVEEILAGQIILKTVGLKQYGF